MTINNQCWKPLYCFVFILGPLVCFLFLVSFFKLKRTAFIICMCICMYMYIFSPTPNIYMYIYNCYNIQCYSKIWGQYIYFLIFLIQDGC